MASGDYDGSDFDFDVVFGRGDDRVTARLVGVPGPKTYHWCITLLPRERATPALVQSDPSAKPGGHASLTV